ncbi:hypothetical protein J2Y56_002118 [Pseudomonas sp. BE134]|nr:hypothetical protein [Pseudomonas sp. BE134]
MGLCGEAPLATYLWENDPQTSESSSSNFT